MSGLWIALTRNGARTDRQSPDAALRGRTYAIPFDRVWNAALAIAGGELRRWRVERSNDQLGLIQAVVRRRLGGVADVVVHVSLDENGQTRVDAEAKSRDAARDFGRSRRRIQRFMDALDRKLGATPEQILEGREPVSAAG